MIHRREFAVQPFNLHATFDMQLLGKFDPTGRRRAGVVEKVQLDANGRVVVWRFTETHAGVQVEVESESGQQLEFIARQFPPADGAECFEPEHPLLRKLNSGYRGLRLLRMPWTFDVAAGAVLQQRVRWQEAYGDFRKIALRWGTRANGAVAFPTAAQLAAVPVARLEALGLDPKRARALRALADTEARRGFLRPDADLADVAERLLSIRGIGPWTTGHILGVAYGAPDAVILGDLHLPSFVGGTLAGDVDADDARMLELLAPYAGQRFRVVRLLLWAWRRTPHVFHQFAGAPAALST